VDGVLKGGKYRLPEVFVGRIHRQGDEGVASYPDADCGLGLRVHDETVFSSEDLSAGFV
jgi:hypothetical protein